MSCPCEDPEVRRLMTALSVLRRESKTAAVRSVLRAELRQIRRQIKRSAG